MIDIVESVIKACPVTLGDHYFIPNPAVNGTGITPVFDFRTGAKKGDPSGFAALKRVGVSSFLELRNPSAQIDDGVGTCTGHTLS